VIIKYAIALAVLLAVAAFVSWAFLPARYLPNNRARHLRLRLHLRLHPGKGFATVFGLWLHWGRLTALRRSRRIRRSLSFWLRLLNPHAHSVFLGWAHYRHGLRVPLEEHLLLMAPPRTFKTAFLADVILTYPGPVIATTTKADVFALTAAARTRRGPVHVFNPQGIGGVPSTFRWSPVAGCEDPATAIRRADAFAFAVSQKGVEDGTFWSAKASDYLRGYFHAAALMGADLRTVAAWVSGADPHIQEQVLVAAGAHQWAVTLAELRGEATKTVATVRMVMTRARIVCHYDVRDADIICVALLHDSVEDHADELSPAGRPGAFAMLAACFGPRVADLVAAVTNPIYTPENDEHDQYREHVAATLAAHPWARVIKAADFTDNGVGLIYTTGPKVAKLARKYAPLVPVLADLIARPDTPLTCHVKARILRQLGSAQERFAAISSANAA
jgi:Type IV secretory system Conjugative DNA transfer